MTTLTIAMMRRKLADTSVPTNPPTSLAALHRSCIAAAVAAIASDARITMVE